MLHRVFFCACVLFSSPILSNEITHSIIPTFEKIEDEPLTKFSEYYIKTTTAALANQSEKIRVVTYNILFDVFDDQLKDKNYAWSQRSVRVIAAINNMSPHILCVQEAYPIQVQDLCQELNQRYACFIGEHACGELNAIFYDKGRFEIIEGNFTQSIPMPLNSKDDEIVSKIPGFLNAELEPGKQMTMIQLRDLSTGKPFVVMNTHLTYHRVNSREDQALFIIDLVKEAHGQHLPVILTGDLNTFPNRPDKPEFHFYDGDYICSIFNRNLKDTADHAVLGHIGPLCTSVRDFLSRQNKPLDHSENPGVLPDHIFVSPKILVILQGVEPCMVDSYYPSDHLPVVSDLILP
jgi:endonuclease/exonuclease/phosphatase family metal-dependent hydrolase